MEHEYDVIFLLWVLSSMSIALLLILSGLEHECDPLLLEFGLLVSDDEGEQLVLEASPGEGEVDEGDLDGHLWHVVGVA